MKPVEYIKVAFNNEKSMRAGRKKRSRLEDAGYVMSYSKTGFDYGLFIYVADRWYHQS